MSIGNDLPEYAWSKQIRNGVTQLLNASAAYHPQTRQAQPCYRSVLSRYAGRHDSALHFPHTKRGILLELSVLLIRAAQW